MQPLVTSFSHEFILIILISKFLINKNHVRFMKQTYNYISSYSTILIVFLLKRQFSDFAG